MSIKNNKGFLLTESLIVSTFVLTVLTFLFVQFRNLMTNYKTSYTYNSVEDIYNLGSMADYLKSSARIKPPGEGFTIIYDGSGCQNISGSSLEYCNTLAQNMNLSKMIYTSSDINSLKNDESFGRLDKDFRDFILKIDATKVLDKGRLIAKFENGNFATIAVDYEYNSELYVSNSGDDETGLGTIGNPYQTIKKAYEEAGKKSTIYIMNDISLTESINMNSKQKKDITITSSAEANKSITRANNEYLNMFDVKEGTLTLKNIEINGDNLEVAGSAISVEAGANLFIVEGSVIKNNFSTGNGAGINSSGNVSLYGGSIEDNKATKKGGGVYLKAGSLKLKGTTIKNNNAFNGGGIFNMSGDITIEGGEINSNTTSGTGAGIYNASTLKMTGGIITQNIAETNGGGIQNTYHEDNNVTGSTLIMEGGSITENVANGNGGGGIVISSIETQKSTATIKGNAIISDNETPNGKGSGIYVAKYSTLNIYEGEEPGINIKDNKNSASDEYPENFYLSTFTSTLNVYNNNSLKVTINNVDYNITPNQIKTLALDVAGGIAENRKNVQLYNIAASDEMKWKIYPRKVENGITYYGFASAVSDTSNNIEAYSMYLTVKGNSDITGTNVYLYNIHPTASGRFWTIESQEGVPFNKDNNTVLIKNIKGLCLNAESQTSGGNVNVTNCTSTNSQKWSIIPVS